jgi:hypothetical protein
MPTLRSRERNVQVGRRPARLGLSRCRQGIKTGPASTASVVRSRRPDHVTQPKSTNTARLICWRIGRDQVPAAFSAARPEGRTCGAILIGFSWLARWPSANYLTGSRIRSVRSPQSRRALSWYRVHQGGRVNRAGRVGQAGARTKNAYKIAPASNTERPRSKVRWQTLRRGNDEEWSTVFGKFDIGSDMSAGDSRGDGNRHVPFRYPHPARRRQCDAAIRRVRCRSAQTARS